MMAAISAFFTRHRLRLLIAIAVAMSGSIVFAVGEREPRIDYITVEGDLNEAQARQVEERLARLTQSETAIDRIKSLLEAEDWIYRADVAFHWPNELTAEVTPEEPIAYWNDEDFINADGDIFRSDMVIGGDLPLLYGPDAGQAELMKHYRVLSRMLAPRSFEIKELRISDRGGIEFRTRSGMKVVLGNVDINARLARTLRVLEAAGDAAAIVRVDARYTNGVAVERQTQTTAIDETKSMKREEL